MLTIWKLSPSCTVHRKKLYPALESLDNALKTCELEGLDIRKISLLRTKLDLLKANKLERSALDISEEINLTAKIQKERMLSLFMVWSINQT